MKKIIIIGAGIAGLSAGIYAPRNGYDATIYEMHFLPGGMCTAWKREGFIFEGCMHYVGLVGSSPKHTTYHQWKELGVIPKMKLLHQEIFHTFRDKNGRTFNMYTNLDRLEKEMLSLSPSDAQEVKELCKVVKRYTWFIRNTGKNPFLLFAKAVGILRGIPLLKNYGDMNMGEYAARFKDTLLRDAFTYLFGYSDFACTNIFFFLAGNHLQATGFPQGSSLAFARTIERNFLELGGEIKYEKKVERILIEGGRAIGIELEDRFTPPSLRNRFETQPHYPPFIQVSLRVNRELSDTPHAIKVQTEAPFEIAGQSHLELWYQHFAFDPTMAPPGKTSLTVLYPSDLAWWERIGYQNEAYRAEKHKILGTMIAQLERCCLAFHRRLR